MHMISFCEYCLNHEHFKSKMADNLSFVFSECAVKQCYFHKASECCGHSDEYSYGFSPFVDIMQLTFKC